MDTWQVVTQVATIIGTIIAVYGLLFGQKALLTWLKDRQSGSSAARAPAVVDEARNQRNKIALLEKVETHWIRDVLEPSIRPTGLLELDLEYKVGAVEGPWEQDRRHALPAEPAAGPFHAGIVEVFDRAHGRLLILGEPGSGKTMALLELARCLIARARQDSRADIPVVFNLASWAEDKLSIEPWLMDELSLKYQIPPEIGRAWIQRGELLLLFDGLDEVKRECRADCVNAINSFLRAHEEVRLAICCRRADYERIQRRLKLHEAVLLQPLTSEKVEQCLLNMANLYPDLQSLFQKDAAWLGFAHSPLLLNSLVIAFKQTLFASMPEFKTMEDRRRYLLAAYVDTMFEQEGVSARFTRKHTLQWLGWLAEKMKGHGQDLFLIEKIQPDWLPNDRRRLYGIGIRLFVALMAGASFGLATGVAAGMVFGSTFGLVSSITFGIAWALIGWLAFERAHLWRSTLAIATAAGIAFGVAGWMALGMRGAAIFSFAGLGAGALAFGFGNRQVRKISSLGTLDGVVLVEALKWSWINAAISVLSWIPFGLLVGLAIGTPVWLVAGPRAGLIYGIATTLVYVITFGVAGGWEGGEIEKTVPNQGIWRSRHNGSMVGSLLGLAIAMIFGISFGFTFGVLRGLLSGLTSGLAGWTVGWLLFGGLTYIQHYWLRTLLTLERRMPWKYSEFLNYAAERSLLRTVGGGYMFIHRLLLDYFAQG